MTRFGEPYNAAMRGKCSRRGGAKMYIVFALAGSLMVIGGLAYFVFLPALNRSTHRSLMATEQQLEIARLSEAIQQYYNDCHSYPGPIPDDNLIGATAGSNPICTSSQNLVWGLMGGWRGQGVDNSGSLFSSDDVGRGPVEPRQERRLPPYIDATYLFPQALQPAGGAEPFGVVGSPRDPKTNAYAPVFVYAIPPERTRVLPILYLRCRFGVQSTPSNPCICSSESNGLPAYYDIGQLRAYGSACPELLGKTPPKNPATGKPDYATWSDYFSDPNLNAPGGERVPRQKDGYLIIGPGSDGIFGTADDIFNR